MAKCLNKQNRTFDRRIYNMIRNRSIYLTSFFVLLYFCISFFIYLRVRSSRERDTFEEENHRGKNEIYAYRVEIDNH